MGHLVIPGAEKSDEPGINRHAAESMRDRAARGALASRGPRPRLYAAPPATRSSSSFSSRSYESVTPLSIGEASTACSASGDS